MVPTRKITCNIIAPEINIKLLYTFTYCVIYEVLEYKSGSSSHLAAPEGKSKKYSLSECKTNQSFETEVTVVIVKRNLASNMPSLVSWADIFHEGIPP